MNYLLHRALTQWRIDPLGVAMPGVRLPERVRKIVDGAATACVSPVRAASMMIACVAMCAAFLAVTLSRAQSSVDWEKAAGGKMSFEVASVKPNHSGPGQWGSSSSVFDLGDKPVSGVLRATNLPLVTYIAFAYKLDPIGIEAVSMQLPQWARHPFYDVEAELPGHSFTKDQVRLMMRSLLADRFKLAVHFEAKAGPAYALVLAKAGKLGSGMRAYPDGFPCSETLPPPGTRSLMGSVMPTVDDGRLPSSCGQIQFLPPGEPGIMHEAGRNLSIDVLFDMISIEGHLDRPLVDRTGLSGTFDISVEFSRPVPPGAGPLTGPPGATFLEALSDQLGLKLESITTLVRSPVIDHIEELTAN